MWVLKERIKASTNHKSSDKNEGDTIDVVRNGDVLFTVSLDGACLYTSSRDKDEGRTRYIVEMG